MTGAIGYRRVSTAEQGRSGLGLEAQPAAIEATAVRLGLGLRQVFEDVGVSGSAGLERRPGLAEALNALRRGVLLVVAKRDRIARDAFLGVLIERSVMLKGARIVSAGGEGTESDCPSAIFTRRILDAVAELERALIAARTRAALQAKRQRGELAGGVPFGFAVAADGRTLLPHPEEQRALAVLDGLRADGLTLRAIAAELNRRGFRTRRGGLWQHQYVAQHLARRVRWRASA